MTTTIAPGTQSPQLPQYTLEQLAKIEEIKAPGFELTAAAPEFKNRVLLPDGTILPDVGVLIDDLLERRSNLLAAGALMTNEDLQQAVRLGVIVEEVQTHVLEERFLFVVTPDFLPSVYFQCAVPDNPDVY